jgi:hypothetical protein
MLKVLSNSLPHLHRSLSQIRSYVIIDKCSEIFQPSLNPEWRALMEDLLLDLLQQENQTLTCRYLTLSSTHRTELSSKLMT